MWVADVGEGDDVGGGAGVHGSGEAGGVDVGEDVEGRVGGADDEGRLVCVEIGLVAAIRLARTSRVVEMQGGCWDEGCVGLALAPLSASSLPFLN